MEPDLAITVQHAAANHCYELLDGGVTIGRTEYVPASDPAEAERIFFHTEVDDAYAGRGLAAVLARYALDDTIAAGLTIIPVCRYIKSWILRHPEYLPHSARIEPSHLAQVRRVFKP